ncbi:MAG: hypothetical protein J1E35_10335 [Lachnospiraceae bacterium]|nr:hypothetical protein [Lachnospiraceae bacterium]
MRILIGIRLKSMFFQIKKSFGGKKKGMAALIVLLLGFIFCAIEASLFGSWYMMSVYLETDFSWLYFALAGLIAFAFGIIGTVFMTQNQMYQAKDNELLLAMPLKPSAIIGSRILVLYLLTFFFAVLIMIPAALVYFLKFGFSGEKAAVFFLVTVLVSMLAQAVTCLLGWLLHFLLAGFRHKAVVAAVFMAAVMILYFVAVNKIEELMLLLVTNGGKIASAIQTFAWPFYALGNACLGDWTKFLLFAVISLAVFGTVLFILSMTFVKAMLAGGKTKQSVKRKRDEKVRFAEGAVCRKESKRFFSSTAYLVNMGMGLFMTLAFAVGGVVMRERITELVQEMFSGGGNRILPVLFSGIMGILAAMTPISAPSVSLEGKQLWILRSMPIRGAQVLKGKLRFHCIATVPVAAVSVLTLGFAYGCGIAETILSAVSAVLMFTLCGSLGLVLNLCFPRFDWMNEATPCKQSLSVMFAMFGMFLFSIVYIMLGFAGNKALGFENGVWVLLLMTLLLAGINVLSYLLLIKWGGKKFERL